MRAALEAIDAAHAVLRETSSGDVSHAHHPDELLGDPDPPAA
jgi:hypothetical protein